MVNALDLSWCLSTVDRLGRLGDLRLRRVFRRGYRRLQDDSRLMKDTYRFTEKMIFQFDRMRDRLTRLHGQPDLILSIQPEINVVAELLKSWYRVHFHTIIIDLAIHGLWVEKSIDIYYVPNEPMKRDLMRYGVNGSRIIVSGMPLRDGFTSIAHRPVKQIRKKLGLDPGLKTILLIGGLLGKMIDFERAIGLVSGLDTPVQVVAIFGENEGAMNRVSMLKDRMRCPVHLYGRVTNMHELMWASDVIISKPGSVTISEVLGLGRPLIAISPLAGSAQELRFAQFLEDNGAGIWIKNVEDLGSALETLIRSRSEYDRVSRNARVLGQYGVTASKTIMENIAADLERKEGQWQRV
jgi:processive 1,2-diacylglycerol beta-glucosyltransferase